jgi:hypothetical protein
MTTLKELLELEGGLEQPNELDGYIPQKNKPVGINTYRTSDHDEFPTGKYILDKTGRVISKQFRISEDYDVKEKNVIKIIKDFGAVEVFRKEYFGTDYLSSNKTFELETESGITIINVSNTVSDDIEHLPRPKNKNNKDVHVSLFSNDTDKIYINLVNKLTTGLKIKRIEDNQVHLVIATRNGYDTAEFDLPKQKLDIELNYGKDFKPVHNKILKELSKNKGKGLVLLHGTPGTGKTHYLKYLASKIKNKKVLFIPPYLADFITSPEMTPFLIENSNSILFIEDAEKVITDRNIEGSRGVSNILNLTDGILSDILNIQIVATFNMDKKKIDTALLRKGRLIAEHKFGKLSLEETKKLIEQLGYDKEVKEGLTLSEIYNIKEEEYKSDGDYMPKIGFGLK